MSVFRFIKQLLCKHEYRKHYDRDVETYIHRCVKCGKVIYKRWR